VKIFSGTANPQLTKKIANELGIPVSPIDMHIFPDGEKRIRVIDRVVDEHCIVVQPTATPVDAHYMELFFIVDALARSGAQSVTAIVPYLGYQRQDHVFRDGEAVSIEVIAHTLEASGISQLIVCDLHTIKTPEIFRVPVFQVSALSLFAQKIKDVIASEARQSSPSTFSLISPDMGGVRRIKLLSEMLDNMPYAVVEKNRDLESGKISAENITGKVAETVCIVDDMIATGGTIVEAANMAQKMGAKKVFACATHPVFSGDASEVLQNSIVEKVFVTDDIVVPAEKIFPKLEIISIAGIIAKELKTQMSKLKTTTQN